MITSLLVVGGGVMGRGIARLFANAGVAVTVVDTRPITFSHPGVSLVRALPAAAPELVIEAVNEDAAIKARVFEDVEARYGGAPVLATNTSGLPLESLAAGLRHGHRFLGMHFFMPADVSSMVEVVRAPGTEDSAVDLAVGAVRQAGREPVLLQRPVTGYLINRLQHAMLHEAYFLLEEGIATPDTIDKVAKGLFGPRFCVTGLLEQKDIGGLEIHARAQRAIVPTLAHTRVPSPLLQGMVQRGEVGTRSGRGFYDWTGRDPEEIQRNVEARLRRLLTFLQSEETVENPAG
jgi:3-hydroxybutyryl-CoA dehydrogenase